MCRFVVYRGREILMSELITESDRSLITQSYRAREREEPLNGDGFGVGWYSPEVDPIPCVFTSVQPAWSNRNLNRLSRKIRSTCFFGHIRAATPGFWVNEANCHPFHYDRFLWMHNGAVPEFHSINRTLRDSLKDETYNFIQGTTDTEHTFALFLDRILDHLDDYTLELLQESVVGTIHQLNQWTEGAGTSLPAHYNFAVTDGQSVIATRYVNHPDVEPQSLYVSYGSRFESQDGVFRMIPTEGHVGAVIIASEPLTEDRSDWHEVPKNHMVVITPELHFRFAPIE